MKTTAAEFLEACKAGKAEAASMAASVGAEDLREWAQRQELAGCDAWDAGAFLDAYRLGSAGLEGYRLANLAS